MKSKNFNIQTKKFYTLIENEQRIENLAYVIQFQNGRSTKVL